MRMKKWILMILLLCVPLVLQACARQPEVEGLIVAGQQTPQPAATAVLTTEVPVDEAGTDDFDDGTYDPSSEEDTFTDMLGVLTETSTGTTEATPAPTISSEHAGATPVLLDPIDKPTDTPVPALTFAYQTYDATNIRLTFDAPEGWLVDSSISDTYVLTNPDTYVDYQAKLILRAVSVNATMSNDEMINEVKQIMATEKGNYAKFSSTNTASRTFLGAKGYYANYTATTFDGVQVAGRVHVACIEKTMYTVHISYPRAYTETYTRGVYNKLRSTVKAK